MEHLLRVFPESLGRSLHTVATAEEPPAFSVCSSSQIPEAALFLKQLTRHVRPGCLIELGVGPIHQLVQLGSYGI